MGCVDATSERMVQDFRASCASAMTVSEVKRDFLRGVTALGFKHVALCQRVHLTRPPADAIVFENLPTAWASHYAECGYHLISGGFDFVHRGAAPFFWEDPHFIAQLTPAQRAVYQEAGDFGLRDGFVWPLIVPGAGVALCTFFTDQKRTSAPPLYAAGGMVAMYAYARAREILSLQGGKHLSARERQCLALVAEGKSDWAIAQILHLSERTVHNTLERAKGRLGVSTRVQAVIHALEMGEIALERHRSRGPGEVGEGGAC